MADQFFEYLREGHVEKAISLEIAPEHRMALDGDVWLMFRRNGEMRRVLMDSLKLPEVRAILELGQRADVRYFRTDVVSNEGDRGMAQLWYTVTFDDAGKKKTFVVGILMERTVAASAALNPWRVHSLYEIHGL